MLRTEEARGLLAGSVAHALRPFSSPLSSAIGLALGASAHRWGWPVAEGGSASISRATTALLAELGGRVETGVEVTSLDELGHPDLVLLDVAPGAAARIVGDRLPARVRRAYERYRHGPGAFKVDLAVEGGVPWSLPAARSAGTVHVGGTLAEIDHAEREVHRGRMPERPFVLVGQQHLADPARSRGDVHPVYAYAHVPAGWDGDPAVALRALESQLERFAPGLRERVLARHVTTPADWERINPNYVGGDIVTGANTPTQLLLRPRPALDPYATGVDGSTCARRPPRPARAPHGLCGWNAARSALRSLGDRSVLDGREDRGDQRVDVDVDRLLAGQHQAVGGGEEADDLPCVDLEHHPALGRAELHDHHRAAVAAHARPDVHVAVPGRLLAAAVQQVAERSHATAWPSLQKVARTAYGSRTS